MESISARRRKKLYKIEGRQLAGLRGKGQGIMYGKIAKKFNNLLGLDRVEREKAAIAQWNIGFSC